MKTIVVEMSDERWTMEAMHLASALARSVNGKVVLLHLVLAKNPGLLGWGIAPPTAREERQLQEYAAVAEDYGVEFWIQPMQFISSGDALVQAAEVISASVLFAHIPETQLHFWKRFQLWNLRRRLHNCRLYTLDEEQPLRVEEPASSTVWG